MSAMALGWSVTESIFTRFVNFYMNARSLQFDWQHLITAGEANLALVSALALHFHYTSHFDPCPIN